MGGQIKVESEVKPTESLFPANDVSPGGGYIYDNRLEHGGMSLDPKTGIL